MPLRRNRIDFGRDTPRSRSARIVALALLLGSLPGCKLPFRDGPAPKQVVEARQLSQRGITAMQRGDWASAEQLLGNAARTCPTDTDARRQYAEALWHRGAQKEALAQIEECIKQSDDPMLFVRLGEMQLALGNADEALRCSEQALNVDPKTAAAWSLHGHVLKNSAEQPHALADFERALSYNRDDRALLMETAELYHRMNKPQRALLCLQSLLDTYPTGEEPQHALYLQGLALTALGRYDDAADSQALAAQRGTPSAEIWFRLAEAHLAAGRLTDAQAASRQALAIDPQHQPSLALFERIQVAQRGPPSRPK